MCDSKLTDKALLSLCDCTHLYETVPEETCKQKVM